MPLVRVRAPLVRPRACVCVLPSCALPSCACVLPSCVPPPAHACSPCTRSALGRRRPGSRARPPCWLWFAWQCRVARQVPWVPHGPLWPLRSWEVEPLTFTARSSGAGDRTPVRFCLGDRRLFCAGRVQASEAPSRPACRPRAPPPPVFRAESGPGGVRQQFGEGSVAGSLPAGSGRTWAALAYLWSASPGGEQVSTSLLTRVLCPPHVPFPARCEGSSREPAPPGRASQAAHPRPEVAPAVVRAPGRGGRASASAVPLSEPHPQVACPSFVGAWR